MMGGERRKKNENKKMQKKEGVGVHESESGKAEEERKEKTTAFSRGGILPRRTRPGSICITGIYRQRGPAWRQNRACPRYVISLDSSSHDGRVRRSLEELEREKERRRMRYASGGGGGGGGGGKGDCALDCGAHKWRSARGV